MSVLVGKPAPVFTAKVAQGDGIIENFSLKQYLGKKYVIFFFYPKDFTFVCPTELHRFEEEKEEFEKRNTAVVGCSTDSEFTHQAWLKTPKNKGGIEGISYPLVADINKTIANAYDVLAGDYILNENEELDAQGELVALRGLFLIDKKGIVQHQLVNNMPLGRSINECIRVLDALQHFEKNGEVCPMDWQKGGKAMRPNHEGVSTYLSE